MRRRVSERQRWCKIAWIGRNATEQKVAEVVAILDAFRIVGRVVRAQPDGYGGVQFYARRGR